MLKRTKKHGRTLMAIILTATLTISSGITAFAKEAKTQPTSYRTITEIQDWGAATTKIIVELGRPVPQGSVTTDTFDVNVVRTETRKNTVLFGSAEGNRKVLNAYVSDEKGMPAVSTGKYAVLEMEIGPNAALGSPLNYSLNTGSNAWVDCDYTITQQNDIVTNAGIISGLTINTFEGDTKVLIDDFATGQAIYDNVTLTYASYTPKNDPGKDPLIIWLHGGGEGGTDPTIPLAANKSVNLITDEIQSYFDGAYVLVPQAPTKWMDGFDGLADGTSIYSKALMELIQDYVSKNKDIDTNRIYIGGCSNGGYMTMLMVRDYPGYFAAAYPVCEGLGDTLITNEDIDKIAQTPLWFTAAKNDITLPPSVNTIPTYDRLMAAGANVHLSLFEDVHDTTGLYKNEDGTPYQYSGHWSWIYVYNNECTETINGKETTIMEWLAAQSLNK